MALTSSEERAEKISQNLEIHLNTSFDNFRVGSSQAWKTPPLYKQRDGGIAKSWITVQEDPDTTELLLTRSVINPGKSQQNYVSVIKPTKTKTAMDRALVDVKKRITKKLRDAWCETPEAAEDTSADTLQKPMLLHKWEKQKQKINYPCIMSVKADGIRCMYDSDTKKLYSRSGKVIELPHITDALEHFVSFDGELCFEDPTVPLPEVIHAIAHQDPNLKYHIFDRLDHPDADYESRMLNGLEGLLTTVSQYPALRLIQMKVAYNEQEVDEWYTECTSGGMEGIVIRNLNSVYQFGKRAMDVLKYKQEFEDTYEIIGYVEDRHPEGNLVKFICQTKGSSRLTFEVVPAWKHEERREMLKWLIKNFPTQDTSHISAPMLVEYRGITQDCKPFHAVGKTKFQKIMGAFVVSEAKQS